VPVGDWLRGPLREWAGGLLEPGRIRQQGLLAPEAVARYWREHQRGEKNHFELLWRVLMFEAWHDNWFHSEQEAVS
jgi:asparagine synthase (glutamine-hydrolysing)